MLAEIERLVGHRSRHHVAARPGDVRHSQADASRLHGLFPDVRPVPFADGLGRTLEWFQGLR